MLQEDAGNRSSNLDSYRERITNFSNEFDLGLFIYIVKRSLVWIVLCISLALAAAYIYLRYTAPTYESRSVIQLSQTNNAQKVLKMNDLVEDDNLRADVELLRSKFFIDRMLKRLPLEISYYFKGQVLTTEFYTGSFFQLVDVEVRNEKVRGVPVSCIPVDPSTVKLAYAIGGEQFTFDQPLNGPFITPHFAARVLLEKGHDFRGDEDGTVFFVINDTKAKVGQYRSQINVVLTDPEAKTVSISCRDKNPVLARDLAQTMAEAFIDYDVERKSKSAESILRFIESQKASVFEELRKSEMDLQEFRRDNKVADMEELVPLLLERTDQYEDELLKLRIEDNLLLEVERSTQGQVEQVDSYTLIPLLVGTSFEQTLSRPIATLEELLDLKQEYVGEMTPVNELLVGLERRIGLQQKLVLESITTLRARIASQRKDIEARIAEYDSRFSSVPEKQLAYARVARLFNINEKYYTQLLEKDIEYRISRAGFVPENSVLESAVQAVTPLSPDRNLVILSYLATGIILGFLIVLVRYVLHDNVTSLNDIVKASNSSISVLGMIPKYKKEIPVSQLLVDKNPKSLIAESFRSVRTNLDFVDNSPGARVIAVTSTISGEGKTFVAINLAGIISFSGKRVIILDLDMRKPKIHLGFGVDNAKGMSTLLINKNTMEECIQHSAMMNLDLITAGPIPPNPSELIISQRMQTILEELKNRYDVILIDNPPVGLVTDGIAMIQKADIPIYIFRADYSKKTFVHNADRLINESKITRLSAVLNGVDVDRNKYGYNYGYGYGYGYGTGYGYYEDRAKALKRKPGLWARLTGRA